MELSHRTTNAVEERNNRLASMIPNSRIKELIQCLKTDAKNSALVYMRIQLTLKEREEKSNITTTKWTSLSKSVSSRSSV